MTSTAPTKPSVCDATYIAAAAWNLHSDSARHGVLLTPWTVETAADGDPMITARATGERAELAMRQFASPQVRDSLADPFASYEQRPHVDYSEPGRVVCSWREAGVWVRLWAADTAAAPAPTPLVMPAKARTAAAPSGRLPIRRPARTGPFVPTAAEFSDTIHCGIPVAWANEAGDAMALGHHDPHLAFAAFTELTLDAELPGVAAVADVRATYAVFRRPDPARGDAPDVGWHAHLTDRADTPGATPVMWLTNP